MRHKSLPGDLCRYEQLGGSYIDRGGRRTDLTGRSKLRESKLNSFVS